jgi:hypothetical protein
MSRILLASLVGAAAIAVPASSAHAAPICVYSPVNGNALVCVQAETEGLAPYPGGGYTSASTIWVTINGTPYCIAIGRATVTTGGHVSYDRPYFC